MKITFISLLKSEGMVYTLSNLDEIFFLRYRIQCLKIDHKTSLLLKKKLKTPQKATEDSAPKILTVGCSCALLHIESLTYVHSAFSSRQTSRQLKHLILMLKLEEIKLP